MKPVTSDKEQWIKSRKAVTEERERAIQPAQELRGAFLQGNTTQAQKNIIDRFLGEMLGETPKDVAATVAAAAQGAENEGGYETYLFNESEVSGSLIEGVFSDYRAELNNEFEEELKTRAFDEKSFSKKSDNKYKVKIGESGGQLEINCDYYYDLQNDFPSFPDQLPKTKPFIGFVPIDGDPTDTLVRGIAGEAIQGWYLRKESNKPKSLDDLHAQNKKAYFFICEGNHWLSVEIIFQKNASGANEVDVNYSNPSGGQQSGCSSHTESFIKKMVGCLQNAVQTGVIETIDANILGEGSAKVAITQVFESADVSKADNVNIREKHLLEQATRSGCGPTAKANLALLMGDKVRIGKVEISQNDIDAQGMMLLPEDELRLRLQDYYEILKFDDNIEEARCGVANVAKKVLENLVVIKDYNAPITSPDNREISIRDPDLSSEVKISDDIATQIPKALKNSNCRVTNNKFEKNKISPKIPDQINDQLKINKSQNAFQDAVYDVFKREGKSPASAQERARLRDQLADAVLPDCLAEALRVGNEQLDGAEFMTHFLDAIMPEKNKIKDTLTIKWELKGLKKQKEKKENSCKLDLPFISSTAAKGTIKCSEMFSGYCAEEDMKGENQFEYEEGWPKVDAKISRSPVVTDPGAEIVVSLKRFKEDGASGCYARIDNPVDLDPIELAVEGELLLKQKYNATAFIVHQGRMGGGHYVAYIQEGDEKWYCYNDSSKREVKDRALESAKSQAYVVKYSPVGANGKCKLPESQGDNGTTNGGNRCWANAAFAFALSMVSLHDDDHERGVATSSPQELYKNSCRASGNTEPAEELLGTVLELDSSEEKSLKDVIEALQKIDELWGEKKEVLNQRLEEIRAVSTSRLLANAVEKYLFSLIEDQEEDGKIEAILGLRGFLSDEGNKGDALKIFNAIEDGKDAFIDDPKDFCSKLISPDGGPDSKKELLKSKARRYLTTADLCYRAILAGEINQLKELLLHAIKLDKEFLTNALCYAVVGEKTAIANFLIDEFKANPNKESSLYEKTADDLDEKKILKEKSGLKGGHGESDSGVDSDSEGDEESLDGSEGKLSKEIEIEGMKVSKDKKTITLSFKDSKGDKAAPITIDVKENKFLKVGDTSSGEPRVEIKSKDFRKELMKYYLSGPGKNEEARTKYEAPEEKVDVVGKDVLEVLNIYRAVPSTSIAARSASKVIVGDLIRGR